MELRNGYKQTEVGVIPSDWECQELMNYFSLITYGFTNPMPTVESGVYMVTANDINGGRIKLETARRTTEFAYRKLISDKSRPKKNDILLTKDGTLGRLAIVGEETICINQSVALIRPNEKVYPLFLKFLLEGSYYQKTMIENAGGSTIKHIYITIVNRMPVGIPLLTSEQTAIATALSDADAMITSLEKHIAKKRSIKQGAMQQLLKPKKGWETKRLGDIAEIVMGQSPLSQYYNLEGNGLPLVQGNADILDRKTIIRSFTSSITKKGKLNDIIMSVRAPVGEIARATFDCCLGRGVCAIRFSNDYLYHYLIFLEKSWGKLSSGSTFDSVNSTQVRELDISIPSTIEEQIDIATILNDMDDEIVATNKKLEKARMIKQGMMQNLLTGKIRLV